ncbi:hypothetical protein BGW80DRAFT_1330722 [Lactifluus volemus]|nr:hypothetical protein BGW80DRAFT_1357972 [Lactifluus volemus]KAH9970420.1 hypothetical protein BGW80DRAFT_1330722 [Lactifluus volemus]
MRARVSRGRPTPPSASAGVITSLIQRSATMSVHAMCDAAPTVNSTGVKSAISEASKRWQIRSVRGESARCGAAEPGVSSLPLGHHQVVRRAILRNHRSPHRSARVLDIHVL